MVTTLSVDRVVFQCRHQPVVPLLSRSSLSRTECVATFDLHVRETELWVPRCTARPKGLIVTTYLLRNKAVPVHFQASSLLICFFPSHLDSKPKNTTKSFQLSALAVQSCMCSARMSQANQFACTVFLLCIAPLSKTSALQCHPCQNELGHKTRAEGVHVNCRETCLSFFIQATAL